jgi:hypothetical protein
VRRFLPLPRLVISLCLLAITCCQCRPALPDSFQNRLETIISPYRFNFAMWELAAFAGPNGPFARYSPVDITDTQPVLRYLELVQAIRAQEDDYNRTLSAGKTPNSSILDDLAATKQERDILAPQVERIVAGQAAVVYRDMGINTPLDRNLKLPTTWPPIWFKLDQLPNLLVISPRDRIESINKVMLQQVFLPSETDSIEARTTALGVSALIVGLGGFAGTYPSFVASDTDLGFLLHTVSEEWLHQYLAFTPLGFSYVLDVLRIKPNYDAVTMNETLAGIVSDEIADRILTRFYPSPNTLAGNNRYLDAAFDFNREMRQIRLQVDALLAAGQVDEAERYMAERRDYLQQNGYYIRKLNQAYFAFYGTYADSPSSVDPIGDAMRSLRAKSSTLAGFLNTAVELRNKQQLLDMIQP